MNEKIRIEARMMQCSTVLYDISVENSDSYFHVNIFTIV